MSSASILSAWNASPEDGPDVEYRFSSSHIRVCSQSSGGAAVKSQGRQPLVDRGEPSPPSLPSSPGGATGVTVAPAGLCQGERGAGTVPGADAPGYSPPPPFGGSDTFRNRLSVRSRAARLDRLVGSRLRHLLAQLLLVS